VSARYFATAALSIFAVALDAAPRSQTSSDEAEISAAVARVRKAILETDVPELLGNLSRTGLTCTDTKYSYNEVKRFLKDTKSHLYIGLFDATAFSARCGDEYPADYPAISDREFLRTANPGFEITAMGPGWVSIRITSPLRSHYQREWSFHREAGRWKVAGGSFIIGNCSCG
jgi:hypothetical protein